MLHILAAALLLQVGPSQPEGNLKFRDRVVGPTQVTDKDLRPMKAPDCRTEAEIQLTLDQLKNGEPGDCFIRDIRRLSQR